MSPTIAQIDDGVRIHSYRRLTSAVPSQSSIVLGFNEKIERSFLKIFLSVLGLILLLACRFFRGGVGTAANCRVLRGPTGERGDFPRATKFLDLSEKAHLLPEEKKLLEKA